MAKKGQKAEPSKDGFRLIAVNRQARFRYEILEEFEAGIVLQGTEVKSVRAGNVNLRDSFARVRDGEVFLHNAHISPYSHGGDRNHEPTRARKLLLHRREIERLMGQTQEKGLTLVALRMYLKGNHVKVALGLCRGKKTHDKRQTLRERATRRELERAVKHAVRR